MLWRARFSKRQYSFFFSSSLVLTSLALSLLCFIFLDLIAAYQIYLSSIASFWIRLIPLLLGIIVTLILYVSWKEAKLSLKRDKKFRAFIKACILENEFSELSRIVDKNEASLKKRIYPDTLQLLFDRSFVRHELSIRSHLHLRLLSNNEIIDTLSNFLGVIDLVAREMLSVNNSLIQLAVAREYGGQEYLLPNKDELQLIKKTIQQPSWYMKTRFDYPLIMTVSEKISSGEYDLIYNRYNELYSVHQGKSLRINCPIYLALKTHVSMLEKVIDQNASGDFYVSDLFDLLRMICDHSKYDRTSWKEYDLTNYKPPTFAYLMEQINDDFAYLFHHVLLNYRDRESLGEVGNQLSFIWPFCVLYIAKSKNSVSEKFKMEIIKTYFNIILELKDHSDSWGNQLAKDMKDRLWLSNVSSYLLFKKVVTDLDVGKNYIFKHQPWLLKEIEEIEARARGGPSA